MPGVVRGNASRLGVLRLRKKFAPRISFCAQDDRVVEHKALAAGGNKNYEVDELPGLNHLFQTAKTGAISEYGEIEETMSPVAMEKVAAWILKQSSRVTARSNSSQ